MNVRRCCSTGTRCRVSGVRKKKLKSRNLNTESCRRSRLKRSGSGEHWNPSHCDLLLGIFSHSSNPADCRKRGKRIQAASGGNPKPGPLRPDSLLWISNIEQGISNSRSFWNQWENVFHFYILRFLVLRFCGSYFQRIDSWMLNADQGDLIRFSILNIETGDPPAGWGVRRTISNAPPAATAEVFER